MTQQEGTSGLKGSSKRPPTKNEVILCILGALFTLFIGTTAITHKYGPYSGTLLDKDAGEPIPGVGIFVTFHTETPTPGGSVSSTIGAVEAITNEKGEFFIPAKRLYTFRPISSWPQRCIPHFFKIRRDSWTRFWPLQLISAGPGKPVCIPIHGITI